ncbi:MAG: ECF-type sigma factor [Pirellulaceae bacterium]
MNDPEDITCYLSGVRAGDSVAAEVIWRQYFARLVRVARRKLEPLPGHAVDEEDVALSAMHSFCRGMEAGRFDMVDDRNALWKLLVTITARKACKHLRREFAEKRGGGQVRGESAFVRADAASSERDVGIAEVLGNEPTPEWACMVVENVQRMLESLADDNLRTVARMTLEGYSASEIANRLGCARRTVERKLERIRAKWSNEETV